MTDNLAGVIPFDNSYARLPDRFYARMEPARVRGPKLIKLNEGLAEVLGIDPAPLKTPEGAAMLAGNLVPDGADPIAMAYAGHQFGGWSPQLGDGRALLLGEVVDRDGQRRDIQLKGSGRTPFSRGGDGRAPLGPVLREYIVSEAMAALGVPTTRALAAVLTGEAVVREAAFPGAVLTRVAASHIRVGTFQFFAAREDGDGLRALADHVIARHCPDAAGADDPYRALLDAVIARQADLIAQWMGLGFIHGVMNTDNMTISGETIDFGPCAFMDGYHPGMVYSSIDQTGRYAYGNQPRIGQWNLACLAQSLLPLLAGDDAAQLASAQAAVDAYPAFYERAWLDIMRRKVGLAEVRDGDLGLIEALLALMATERLDFTGTFRALGRGEAPADWIPAWEARLADEGTTIADRSAALDAANPLYIPRNHLVEASITAGLQGDFAPFETLIDTLATPFTEQPGRERFTLPPETHEIVHQTFCGT